MLSLQEVLNLPVSFIYTDEYLKDIVQLDSELYKLTFGTVLSKFIIGLANKGSGNNTLQLDLTKMNFNEVAMFFGIPNLHGSDKSASKKES